MIERITCVNYSGGDIAHCMQVLDSYSGKQICRDGTETIATFNFISYNWIFD